MESSKPRAPRTVRPAAKAPRTVKTGRPATAPRTVTAPYDTADYLKTEEDMAGLLEAALEDGHHQVIAASLGAIARAHGMAKIAKETGLNREGLYKTLSGEGNPELDTLLKVIKALGLQLHATPRAGWHAQDAAPDCFAAACSDAGPLAIPQITQKSWAT